jgi:hypothetical protein
MHTVPLYHLSPTGRAAIDAESARIRQELAARRAEREARPQPQQGPDGTTRSAWPGLTAGEAVDPPVQDASVRP